MFSYNVLYFYQVYKLFLVNTSFYVNYQPTSRYNYFFSLQAPAIFSKFVLMLMPPCGLHLILAIHRYLWRFLYDVINKRNQDSLISEALRSVSLDFLAYQIESYFKRYICIQYVIRCNIPPVDGWGAKKALADVWKLEVLTVKGQK